MHLTRREEDKLLLQQAGFLAQKRLARGLRLNRPEAVALIASVLQELIRDGKHSVAQLMELGKTILGYKHVTPIASKQISEIHVEGTFPDSTFLVTIDDPICTVDGDIALALYSSFLPVPEEAAFPFNPAEYSACIPAGAMKLGSEPIYINQGRKRVRIKALNTGDRPIQVGSHYPFAEVNAFMLIDRLVSKGMHLDIPAGTAIRFEPGESRHVMLCEYAGLRRATGANGLASLSLEQVLDRGFKHTPSGLTPEFIEDTKMSHEKYVSMYGPTVGDRVRLGDTDLWVEVERDMTSYGDECIFGGGKSIREGQAQSTGRLDIETCDTIITNALIVDWSGIYKADVGIKNNRICGIGKSGNPDIMSCVDPALIIGVNTEIIGGENYILTAGGVDAHVHFICPQLCEEALSSGITTILGGGTGGPASGTNATTCTPGANYIKHMITASDSIPLNFGFTGKGNDSEIEGMRGMITAGAMGMKLHEDWGTTPAVIDACLELAETYDIAVNIHTDTLNESGFVETTMAAFKGRTIHCYHCEGAGGGHSPNIIVVVGEDNVLPSSTNPTRPFSLNTLSEHMTMLMTCHHLDKSIPEDIAFAESRIRAETIAAEDVLHDMGAISMVSSDSQAMGRIGEVISSTWRTASKMLNERGRSCLMDNEERGTDNNRVKRYIAKYTINPAITHGMAHLVGDISVGKIADLVLWKPANFGTKPSLILKGGVISYAAVGDSNASIPTVQPIRQRPMFGFLPNAVETNSVVFVSEESIKSGTIKGYNLKKKAEPVIGCRKVKKSSMKLNNLLPSMVVDPETFQVMANGEECLALPASALPLTNEFSIF